MPDARRDRLRAELGRLRTLAGLSGRQLVTRMETFDERAGVWQATVSRIESGASLPSLPVVRAWLAVTGASPADTDRLLDLAETLHGETRHWGDILGDSGHAQHEARRREQEAAEVWNFQPTMIPGLLQTADYARAYFRVGRTRNVDDAVAVRLERQQALHDSSRRFRFLFAEQVLTWPLAAPAVMAVQRAQVASLAALPTVEVAVLPAARAVALAWHNFALWTPLAPAAPRYVTTELVHGEGKVEDAELVVLYESLWSRLWSAAATGDDAVALIRAAQ